MSDLVEKFERWAAEDVRLAMHHGEEPAYFYARAAVWWSRELMRAALASAEHLGASTRALELWAMDVLSESSRRQAQALHVPGDRMPDLMMVPIGAAARISAARALKLTHPELPEEPKET